MLEHKRYLSLPNSGECCHCKKEVVKVDSSFVIVSNQRRLTFCSICFNKLDRIITILVEQVFEFYN
jgi:hypothetical protein